MAVVSTRVQDWVPEAGLAVVVLVLGLFEATRESTASELVAHALVVGGVAVGVLLARHAPGPALALVWAVGVWQVVTGTPVLSVQVAVAVVAFGCARWGSPATVVLSGLSIPTAAAVAALLVSRGSYSFFRGIAGLSELVDNAYRFSDTLLVGASAIGMLVLALPWLAGLVLRATARAERSQVGQVAAEQDAATAQREAAQAQEIAALRADQARLARDVHDVVGHSLAVILAQAESAQYLPDEPAQLKTTLATIATSARSSLQDVRQVLSATTGAGPAARPGSLDSLVAGIRASGQEVVVDEVGPSQPLPPELEVVAHRVLQEMLTNAVKHGARDQPIRVERHWPGGGLEQDLRLEVRNVEPAAGAVDETQPLAATTPGQGIDGMRRRVDSVGGRLDVRRRVEADGPTFTATAWVPVRAGS